MDTMKAFARGQVALARGVERKVFDWDKAARLIREHGARSAGAGLEEDWEWTGGDILKDGKPIPREDTYTYLASNHATPELTLDDGEEIPCYKMESEVPGWDSDTYWPESALKILNEM